MEYCPNCGRNAGGRFCQFCGYDLFRGPVQQQTQYAPQQYQGATVPVQYGPPIGERIGSSPMAKMGVIILILCILGLILAVVVPWVIAEKDVGGDYEYTYVCQDCGYSEEDYFFPCPRCDSYDIDSEEEYIEGHIASFSFNHDLELVDGDEDEWGSDEFTSGEAQDYFKDTIGQAFIGLVFVMVIAIILIIVGITAQSGGRSKEVHHGLGAFVAVILIIPGMMILVSGLNFVGFNILEMHTNSNTEALGGEVDSSTIYPAAYLILLFGLIIFIMTLYLTIKEIRMISLSQQSAQPKEPSSPQYPGGGVHG
jgi:hypothetical protein